jgi:NAD-dependent deacetylase
MTKQKLVVLTGAGISAESGIATFRDANGLWEGHRVEDVASPEGWYKNPEKVMEFYNQRRKQALSVQPNRGHILLAALEQYFDVVVVTQNVDNLHEKAGSTNVIHLHGSLFESRSTVNEKLIYQIEGWELKLGDRCELGAQLRPNIVWFGEPVPKMELAIQEAKTADFFLVVGTSLQVYPAAGLIDFVPYDAPKFLVDPKVPSLSFHHQVTTYAENASSGMEKVTATLLAMIGVK